VLMCWSACQQVGVACCRLPARGRYAQLEQLVMECILLSSLDMCACAVDTMQIARGGLH
jgi:hypothetical protein